MIARRLHSNAHSARTNVFLVIIASIAMSSCDKPAADHHHSQSTPKGEEAGTQPPPQPSPVTESTATAPIATDSSAVVSSSEAERPWKAPESWKIVPGERPMRLATYEMQGPTGPVEVAISRFPGDVGGMLANVNRWRGQVGIPPATETDLAGMIEPFENPGFKGSLLHIKGAEQHIVVASIFEPGANQTWTVRASAAPAVAEAIEEDVFGFARTFGAAK